MRRTNIASAWTMLKSPHFKRWFKFFENEYMQKWIENQKYASKWFRGMNSKLLQLPGIVFILYPPIWWFFNYNVNPHSLYSFYYPRDKPLKMIFKKCFSDPKFTDTTVKREEDCRQHLFLLQRHTLNHCLYTVLC